MTLKPDSSSLSDFRVSGKTLWISHSTRQKVDKRETESFEKEVESLKYEQKKVEKHNFQNKKIIKYLPRKWVRVVEWSHSAVENVGDGEAKKFVERVKRTSILTLNGLYDLIRDFSLWMGENYKFLCGLEGMNML